MCIENSFYVYKNKGLLTPGYTTECIGHLNLYIITAPNITLSVGRAILLLAQFFYHFFSF